MAIWGLGVMVGPILGPTLGGWLTETWNWRWVFWINLPVGMLAFAGLSAFLDGTRRGSAPRFDWFGFAMLSLAIGSLQLMLDRGERLDWFDSPEIALEAGIAALAFYLFLVQIFTGEKPFLDPRMFRDRNFAAGLATMFALGFLLLGTLALLAPFLQQLLGYPALTAGFVLAPRGLGTAVSMVIVGRFLSRADPRLLLGFGLALLAATMWQMAGFTAEVSYETLLWTGVVQGFSFGFLFPPLSTVTFSTLAPEWRTQGTALFSLMRNIGASIGIALVIFLLGRNAQVAHAELSAGATPFNPAMGHPVFSGAWNLATEAGRSAFNDEITRQAATIAYIADFRLLTFAALAALPLLLLFRRRAPAPAARG
jgi:DHA2 family multidrug resistance protein